LYQLVSKSQFDDIQFRLIGQVQAEIEAHLDPASGVDKSWKRNASLARVKLTFEGGTAFARSQSSPQNVDAVVNYLREYGKSSTAYNDLRPFVERLSPGERKQLSTILTSKPIFSDAEEFQAGQYPTKKDVCFFISPFVACLAS
jgi:N-terminal acetyltransferase B complex non-catalytic subunit